MFSPALQAVVSSRNTAAVVVGGIDLTLECATTAAGDYQNSITIAKPTNTVDGDFLLACIYIQVDSTSDIGAPAGWTRLGTIKHSGGSTRGYLEVWYKRASSEGANYNFTHSYSVSWGLIKRITGVVAAGDPLDSSVTTSDASYVTTPTSVTNSAVTTATANSAVVHVVCANSSSQTFSTHALANRNTVSSLSLDAAIQPGAGSSGNLTATVNDYAWLVGILLSLKAA